MKISDQDKALVLQAKKVFPEVWVFLQGHATRGTEWGDVIHSLKELLKVGNEITAPWGFLEWKVKELEREREQRGIDQRVEELQRKKIKDKEDLKNCKLGDLIKGVGE